MPRSFNIVDCSLAFSQRLTLRLTVCGVCHPNQLHFLRRPRSDLESDDFKATATDAEAVFAANTDLNSLTLPQTLSQDLFAGPVEGAVGSDLEALHDNP